MRKPGRPWVVNSPPIESSSLLWLLLGDQHGEGMKQTVAILLALGIGFGLGYVVGGMGIERVEGDPYTSFDNKPDAESRARAGSSESGDLVQSHDPATNQRPSNAAHSIPPLRGVEGQPSGASDERSHDESEQTIDSGRAVQEPEGETQPQRNQTRREAPPTRETEGANGETLRTQIQGEFSRIRVSLRECYELLLQLEPAAADRLVFMLLVEPDPEDAEGSRVTLEGIRSDALELDDVSCFADIASELRLPPPTGEDSYRVSYPVLLSAE